MAWSVCLRLDKILEEKHMTRYALSRETGIIYHILDKYYKNKVTRYDGYLLAKMCEALDCEIDDLIEIIKD